MEIRYLGTGGAEGYVKVKTADSSIVKKEITTGLSDGSNVEISGDIAEGDTVLIESSITK